MVNKEIFDINVEIEQIPERFRVFAKSLAAFEKENRLRYVPADREGNAGYDLSTNDYMGLGKIRDFSEFLIRNPKTAFTSSASRLLASHQDSYARLENQLGELYNKDILLFNSGYHANVGVIQSLAVEGTVFLCDKLIHASMIDGLKLGGADYRRWRHNDLSSLEKLLFKYKNSPRVVLMVESIYSMDGDVAPLRELVKLKEDYPNVILYVDEAHGFGVRGEKGLGVCEDLGILDDVDILIGTLGKACASAGAFVATHPLMKQYFMNCCRSFIFSTALPPVVADWSYEMIMKLTGMREERVHLKIISQRFKDGIERITGRVNDSESQIIPLIVGDAGKAIALASRLAEHGITALPIRRPTVAEGEERIRFSLSADLSNSDIDNILSILEEEYYEV